MVKKPRLCAECAQPFALGPRRQLKQLFCSTPCSTRFHNRNGARGKILAPLVMAQREGRASETAKRAHIDYTRLCADWRDQDKAAGRISMHDFVRHQYTHGIGAGGR